MCKKQVVETNSCVFDLSYHSCSTMASDSQDIDFQVPQGSKTDVNPGNGSRADADEVDEENVEENEHPITLDKNEPRRTYLITYSQAQRSIFPSRESFAKACAQALGGDKIVGHYACAEEPHGDGGFHYHVAMKLNRAQRWSTAKKILKEAGAIVNFQGPPGTEGMYAWMYYYISKYDRMLYHSVQHPSLERAFNPTRVQQMQIRSIGKNENELHKLPHRMTAPLSSNLRLN